MDHRLILSPVEPTTSGYVVVGRSDAGVYLDATPDAPVPEGAVQLGCGPDRYAALASTPHADAVLRARVVREIDGEPVELRIPQGEVLPGDEVLETGLAAQRWYGE